MPTKTKALGVDWDTHEDILSVDVEGIKSEDYEHHNPIKFTMLSEVMKMWDPPGLIGHLVIAGRLIIREVWKTDVDWDQEVPDEIGRHQWWKSLEVLKTIKIPRWCGVSEEERELHIFVDASNRATAAMAYIRGLGPSGVTVSLMSSKCRVAPMRQMTLRTGY